MNARRFAAGYAIAATVFLALDGAWLSQMTARLYRPALGHLLAPGFAPLPAILFYLLYAAGIVGFAVAPALAARRPLHAALRGGALGLLAYASYDLSNQATLRGWPWAVTLADLAWGTAATACSAAVTAALLCRRRR